MRSIPERTLQGLTFYCSIVYYLIALLLWDNYPIVVIQKNNCRSIVSRQWAIVFLDIRQIPPPVCDLKSTKTTKVLISQVKYLENYDSYGLPVTTVEFVLTPSIFFIFASGALNLKI